MQQLLVRCTDKVTTMNRYSVMTLASALALTVAACDAKETEIAAEEPKGIPVLAKASATPSEKAPPQTNKAAVAPKSKGRPSPACEALLPAADVEELCGAKLQLTSAKNDMLSSSSVSTCKTKYFEGEKRGWQPRLSLTVEESDSAETAQSWILVGLDGDQKEGLGDKALVNISEDVGQLRFSVDAFYVVVSDAVFPKELFPDGKREGGFCTPEQLTNVAKRIEGHLREHLK